MTFGPAVIVALRYSRVSAEYVARPRINGTSSGRTRYLAWRMRRADTRLGIDKHPSYSFVAGPGGTGLDDFYSPEVDSTVVPLPGVKTSEGASCATIRDKTADLTSWTNSFANIQCYDALKVNALLDQIAGKTHTGAAAQVPALFGKNFQAVYFGQTLNEPTVGAGGYENATALPSAELLNEIEFVDASIGDIVNALRHAGLYDDTLLIITAKHGESPIDPTR